MSPKVAHCAELDISLTGLVLAATLTATAAVTNTNTVRVMVHTNLRSPGKHDRGWDQGAWV